MYCRAAALSLAGLSIAALALVTGCSRRPATKAETQRFAILRFEDLGSGSGTAWIGRAFSEIITTELAGAPGISAISSGQIHNNGRALGVRPISAPGISAERSAAILSGANRLGYGDYSVRNGRLFATLSVEDPQTGKMTKVVSVTAAAGDVLGAASDFARQLSPRAVPYLTHNLECLKDFSTALESHDAAQIISELNAAIAADANFGPAYRLIAEVKAQQQDRAGALAAIQQAEAHAAAMPAVERARVQLAAANLKNDPAAAQNALMEMAKLEPGDLSTWQSLGETANNRHDSRTAADAYRHAVELQPQNVNLLNQLGYAEAYAGDFEKSVATLRQYQTERPSDPNALDSLGDIHLIGGRLKQAQDYYLQAYKKDPNFQAKGELFKAAMACLMTGDITGADALFQQYVNARATIQDTALEFRTAEWLWITGRRDAALRLMENRAQNGVPNGPQGGPQASSAIAAYAETATFDLLRGDRAAATQMAQKSVALGTSVSGLPAVALFLIQPSASVEEWTARANKLGGNSGPNGARDLVLAYALLLDNKFEAAAGPLLRLYNSPGSAANQGLPVLLAWSYLETGHPDRAAELLKTNPTPPSSPNLFMGLYFPRLFDLRAQVAEKSGRKDEARQNRDLYCKLSGSCH